MSDIIMFIFTTILPIVTIIFVLMVLLEKYVKRLEAEHLKETFQTVNQIQEYMDDRENPLKKNTLDD